MTDCTHAQLVLQGGPLHANDDPPQYRCKICNEFLCVTVTPVVIGVHFGNPNDAQSEVEREKISEGLNRMLETQRLEIKRLKAELAASGNYIADREVNPTTITFKNGRRVFLNSEGFLDVAALSEAGASSKLDEDYCSTCHKLRLKPNVAYGINPDAVCNCAAPEAGAKEGGNK